MHANDPARTVYTPRAAQHAGNTDRNADAARHWLIAIKLQRVTAAMRAAFHRADAAPPALA